MFPLLMCSITIGYSTELIKLLTNYEYGGISRDNTMGCEIACTVVNKALVSQCN